MSIRVQHNSPSDFSPGKGANMAAEGDVDLDLEAEENCTGKPVEKPRKHDSGAADLERVTDYAEEKEISSSDLETVRPSWEMASMWSLPVCA